MILKDAVSAKLLRKHSIVDLQHYKPNESKSLVSLEKEIIVVFYLMLERSSLPFQDWSIWFECETIMSLGVQLLALKTSKWKFS